MYYKKDLALLLATSCIVVGCDGLILYQFSKIDIQKIDENALIVGSLYIIGFAFIARHIVLGIINYLNYRSSIKFIAKSLEKLGWAKEKGVIIDNDLENEFSETFLVKGNFVFPFYKSIASLLLGIITLFVTISYFVFSSGTEVGVLVGLLGALLLIAFFAIKSLSNYVANKYSKAQKTAVQKCKGFLENYFNFIDTSHYTHTLFVRLTKLRALESLQDFIAVTPKFILELLGVVTVILVIQLDVSVDGFNFLIFGYVAYRVLSSATMVLNGFSIFQFNAKLMEQITAAFSVEPGRNIRLLRKNLFTSRKVTQRDGKVITDHTLFQTILFNDMKIIQVIGNSGSGKSILARDIQYAAQSMGMECAYVSSGSSMDDDALPLRTILENNMLRPETEEYLRLGIIQSDSSFMEDTKLSLGQRLRYQVIMNIEAGCKFFILDEVLSALDHVNKLALLDYLLSMDVRILVIDHNVESEIFENYKFVRYFIGALN